MLCASVATGTALASDDEPSDTADTVQTETVQTADGNNDETDAGESGGGDAGKGDAPNDVSADGERSDAESQGGEEPETEDGTATGGQSDGRSEDGDSDSQPALQSGDTGVATQALDEHTVQGVTPRGTTINLFDYWVDTNSDGTPQNNGSNASRGINKDHALRFGGGNGGTINAYTSSAQPRSGIVQNRLVDGYPALNSALANSDESLAYLFNPNVEESSRATHTNVGGLLQVDDDGYYYYNSHDNFASYVDGENNDFVLYGAKAVNHGGTSPDGQFFPFNKGTDVFDDDGTAKNIDSNNSVINHYFGLTMQTNFVQQYGGHVDKDGKQPVTYNFSGDDDVWVFVDGVLVGDLGGIHDATALQIDFSTGEVIIFDDNSAKIDQNGKKVPDPNNPNNGNNHYDGPDGDYKGETVYTQTTLKKLFDAAHVGTSDFNGNTLPDNTYHTLSFFYMERGNVDSNMSLKYNLVNIPESGVMKVDAVGTPLNGVNFNLYPADSNYTIKEESNPYTATTDSTGNLIFRHPDAGTSQGTPVSLNELGEVSRYWVLKETNVPEGYRSNGDVQLRFAYADKQGYGVGPLLVSNQWDSGAYSEPHATVQANSTVTDIKNESHSLTEGTMFAVVEKNISSGGSPVWRPISGDPYEGWSIAGDESVDSLVEAGRGNIFTPGTSGAYEVTIEDLPGDITTYEYMINTYGPSGTEARYRVKYYYTTGDLTAANEENTVEIDPKVGGAEFTRVFSVTVDLTNPKNELKLVKTDENGNPLPGAVFTLYQADADGAVMTDDNGAITSASVGTIATGDDGRANVTNQSGVLPEGAYVLVETKAPTGYALQSTRISIIVDDDGVHVNAGTADDNVTVTTGLGTLVYSMKGFAADDQVDATLHDITAQPQTSAAYPVASWSNTGKLAHMQFQDDDDRVLNYGLTPGVAGNGSATFTTDAGWSRFDIRQCRSHGDGVKTPLGDQSLNALFTGDVTINVTNVRPVKVSFPIQKVLEGRSWADDDEFSFTVTADGNNPANGATLPSNEQGVLGTTTNPVAITDETSFTDSDGESVEHAVEYGDIAIGVVGEYRFTVAEVRGNAPGMSYSQDVYTVTVNVESLTGTPNVTIIRNDDKKPLDSVVAVFTNTFTGVSSLPLTGGDTTARNLLLAGGGVLLLAGAAWLLARRRRG